MNPFFTKNSILIAIAIFLIFNLFTHCEQKKRETKSPRIRKSTKVISPKYNSTLNLYDTLRFEIGLAQDTISVDSFIVVEKNKVIYNSKSSNRYSIINQTGEKNLRINLFLSNGKTENHGLKITVFANTKPKDFGYQVQNTFIHDPDAYTQGLIFENGILYESTGQYGTSTLRKVDVSNGNVIKQIKIADEYFGEGIAIIGEELFLLTYKSLKGFIYNKNSFELLRTFEISTATSEGWGITNMGDTLVMSDGSENLYFLDSHTMEEIKKIQVYDQFKPIKQLNELEFINGKIYANIYHSDDIVIIDPQSGQVESKINMAGIFNAQNYSRRLDVLNGIAYNPTSGTLYVTGKWWPKLFEIRITKSTLNN